MASKLFLFSLIMIFLLGFSQANLTKKIIENNNFLGMAKLLNQASEDQKIRFYETSFKTFDENKDGFVTSDEFDNVDFETLPRNFASLVRVLSGLTMTEALIQFDNEHKNGIDHTKVGITLEDYKDALKRKLEQIYGKIAE